MTKKFSDLPKIEDCPNGTKIFDNQFEETFQISFIYDGLVGCMDVETKEEFYLEVENIDDCLEFGQFEFIND